MASPPQTTGKISYFGGPTDPSSGPTTASGAPTSDPGIAVDNQSTLGGWWLLKMPNGLLTLIKQTDIGPNPSTGRTFDFTYSALNSLGYSTSNFPTDSTVSGIYLGKTKTAVEQWIAPAAQSLGADVPNILGWLQTVTGSQSPAGQPQFGASPSQGSKIPGLNIPIFGSPDTGSGDTGNQPVQPGGPSNVISSIGNLTSFFTSGSNWLRLGEALAAVFLLFLGLHALTGQSSSVAGQPVVRHVTRIIPV